MKFLSPYERRGGRGRQNQPATTRTARYLLQGAKPALQILLKNLQMIWRLQMANIRKIEGKTGVSYKITVSSGYLSKGKQKRYYKTWAPGCRYDRPAD